MKNVAHYAVGGAVEPNDRMASLPPQPAPAEAVPAQAPAPAPAQSAAPAPAPAEGGGTSSSDGFDLGETMKRWSIAGNTNPVALGLKALQDKKPTSALPQPGDRHPIVDALHSSSAPAASEVQDLNKVIDPDNELSRHVQEIKKLDSLTNFYLNQQHDQDKAAKVAGMLLQNGRQMSMKLGALAAAALQSGNKDHALQYLKGAYDYMPDGNTLDAKLDDKGNFVARTVNADGETVQDLGTITPEQAFKFAMGNVANGHAYMQTVMSAATKGKSEIEAAKAAAKPAKTSASAGAGRASPNPKAVNDAWDNIKNEMSPKDAPRDASGDIPDPPGAGELKANAYAISVNPQNKSMAPHDAVKMAMDIATPNPADPFKPGFTIEKASGGFNVKRTNGSSAFVPKEQFERLAMIRAEKLKAITDAQNQAVADKQKAATDAAQPGMISRMGSAISNFGGGLAAAEQAKYEKFKAERAAAQQPPAN